MRKQPRYALTSFLLLTGAFVQAAQTDLLSSAYLSWPSAVAQQSAPARLPGRIVAPRAQASAGEELLDELHEFTGQGFKQRPYQEASQYMFSVADNVTVAGQRGVIDSYSDVFVPGRGGEGSDYRESGDENGDGFPDEGGMNVEHVWPQSFFSRRLPMRSDLYNLLPTFIYTNNIRGHLPFGEVAGRGDYSNRAGAKRGQGFFEPPDSAKGMVARSLLYFYTRYNDKNITNGPYDNQAFWNENLERLLRWNKQFPPDQDELRRNDLVERFQGNRNPYVDDPSLADRVGAEGFRRGTKAERRLKRLKRGEIVSPRKR
jgi:hypothetical protein